MRKKVVSRQLTVPHPTTPVLEISPMDIFHLAALADQLKRRLRTANKRVKLPLDTRDHLTPLQRVLARSLQRVK